MRLYSTANEQCLTSQAPFCLPIGKVQARRLRSVGLACTSGSLALQDRKHFAWCFFRFAGGTPAIRWSRLYFRITGASGSQTFRLVFLQIRRRNACITGSRASRLHAVVLNR
ncbi:MAG: hypothetical protein LBP59_13845 [Planctomycetaceae bacterium]|nr:hypothetical protein [Planctomycetaceae bacterium]